MIVRIEITKYHITRGKKTSCSRCPVALAFQDAGFWEAEVDGINVTWWQYDHFDGLRKVHRVCLPAQAKAFVRVFDSEDSFLDSVVSGIVRPFAFNLDVPDGSFTPKEEV